MRQRSIDPCLLATGRGGLDRAEWQDGSLVIFRDGHRPERYQKARLLAVEVGRAVRWGQVGRGSLAWAAATAAVIFTPSSILGWVWMWVTIILYALAVREIVVGTRGVPTILKVQSSDGQCRWYSALSEYQLRRFVEAVGEELRQGETCSTDHHRRSSYPFALVVGGLTRRRI